MKIKSGRKLLLEKREKSKYKFPLLFTKEGQEYMGSHIASIKSKTFKVDYYFKNGYISSITYTNGIGGFLLASTYAILGYVLQLIPVEDVKKLGMEINGEIIELKKKYVYTGSSVNISSRLNPNETSLKIWLDSYLVRNDKEKYVKKIKWNDKNICDLNVKNT
ncbi:hypothetical protein FJQ98_16295 [Lysinibacillus agricola]|uniref:Uncharacterized protein n=1 Tax=Lysinibacillus agricola TaxID=2590012 RepID=A0ABX7ANM3_9BACI|nr:MULTISPECIES: hypothetical protein [Lysinibacillus]KOS61505.1 hypothetical protein AN161_18115 [Lysinibacillus sp. FJAT-14222]QQP10805.1 hypothetical protein FJQ98_16295 [Lysinibacillus agricola]